MHNLEDFVHIIDLDKNLCSYVLDFLTSPECKWENHWFTDSLTFEKTHLENPENILVTLPYGGKNKGLLPIEVGKAFHNMLWKEIGTYLNYVEKSAHQPAIGQMTMARYNKYKVGSYMSKHVDHIHSLFEGDARGIPILSLLVLFNDDFTGGEFKLNDEHINIKKNQLLMFPSIFLYAHNVEPILSGERYTAVAWAY